MANTSSRALRLLSALQGGRCRSAAELAESLAVSERTLRRDVDRLRELGYRVEAHHGGEGGYQLAAGASMPPLLLEDDEAVALAAALQISAQGALTGIAESSVLALTKLLPVLPRRVRGRVEALHAATVAATWGRPEASIEPAVLTALAQACRDTERLRFSYTALEAPPTERHVEPFRLVALGRRWYLVAYDLDRQDWRSFRLDRLRGPRPTGARFRPRTLPATDAAAFVRQGIETGFTVYTVEALVDMPAAEARAKVGRWADVEPVDGGRCRMRMPTESLDWPAMALGTLGAEFQVLSPPELRELLAEWSDRFRRATPGK